MSDGLSITGFETKLIVLPLERTLRTSIHQISTVCCLLVTVHTNEGITGEGYGFCFDIERLKAISRFTQSMEPLLRGRDPHDVEALWMDFLRSSNFYGQSGISILAYTPLDVACWDIIGKHAGRPLYKLFGACRERVPVYASAGLWLSSSIDELRTEARAFLKQGFRAMKMRLGMRSIEEDVARVRAVREAIGDDITLMADANQGLDAAKALRLGRAVAPFNLAWFEEPVPTWNDEAAAMLVRKLDTPIASAETEYTRYGIKRMHQAGAATVFMPDLQRMGGYTEMMKSVRYLAASDTPVSPHIFTEHSLHVVAASANATWCEHMPWFSALFKEKLAIEDDGTVLMPDRPGTGFSFDWDALESYQVKNDT
ncbi:mandelate racemase/muconate lactonizing enzyme family protein [Allopusillimonas soli]|uniref:Mandelate racemase/muconate lactonizing enzyme family protein n=1 Tax=Allopusillimonas soli TaxID=659016 RepID=A0A853FDZ6_9BURK|nr:mandelate racemase/muconate lactonizing enzyme family protein [Allopusillimonas soli]NYT36731.1 mandelate racemase/muconate lactonizing enzyme family protein [Allopusillimonas soli]TEA75206.1 mandelate racemase/muconate lactonizing enzyme family protein [Allopusillimonas soli]